MTKYVYYYSALSNGNEKEKAIERKEFTILVKDPAKYAPSGAKFVHIYRIIYRHGEPVGEKWIASKAL